MNEKAVEAAAEGFYMSGASGSDQHWEDLPRTRKAYFLKRARVALEAAAQYIQAEAWEQGAKAADAKRYLLDQNPYRSDI